MLKHIVYNFFILNVLWSFVFGPAIIFADGIIPDGTTNTTVTTAPNGVPIINIDTPSNGGVSHNKFTDYNVGKNGLILNNSSENGHSSDLGGLLPGNANLNNGPASVILNEVTSSNKSNLKGFTEVSGNKAAVIIANPNGIICEGCGFINTTRTTLVTGSSVFDSNGLAGFNLSGSGELIINNNQINLGFDGNESPADLVSRIVKLNGSIHSTSSINVLTGNKYYDYNTGAVLSDNSISTPHLAIDSSLLGGIYAGRINIVATEKGFGVNTSNLSGVNLSSADSISISADGTIVMNGDIWVKELALNSDNVENKGDIQSESSLNIKHQNDFVNEGKIVAAKDVKIEGNAVANNGKIGANGAVLISNTITNNTGEISGKTVSIKSDKMVLNSGSLVAEQLLDVNTLDFTNDYKLIFGNNLRINSFRFLNNADIVSDGDITINVYDDFSNNNDMQTNGSLTINAKSLTNAALILSYNNLNIITSGDILNTNSGELAGKNSVNLIGSNLHNYGKIQSGDTLKTLLGNDLFNYATAFIISNGDMDLGVNRELVNFKAKIASGGSLNIHGTDGMFEHITDKTPFRDYKSLEEGVCVAGYCVEKTYSDGSYHSPVDPNKVVGYSNTEKPQDPITVETTSYIPASDRNSSVQNIGGIIYGAEDLSIHTESLENLAIEKFDGDKPYKTRYDDSKSFSHGDNKNNPTVEKIIIASSTLTIDDNYKSIIGSGGNMDITAKTILNQSAYISAGKDLFLSVSEINNTRTSFIVNDIYVGMHKSVKKCGAFSCWWTSRRDSYSYSTLLFSDANAVITSGGDMTIDTDTLLNGLTSEGSFEGTNPKPVGDFTGLDEIIIDPSKVSKEYDFNKPDSSYLYETNLRFYDRNAFFGSDYFVGLTGVTIDKKMLGDAYFETNYIMEDILRQAKRPYISGAASAAEQMQILYQNAASFLAANNTLALGEAPTAEQLEAFDYDFIWYVSKTINGTEVLVPTLYLSEASKNNHSGSTMLASGNMDIKANTVKNSGGISSEKDMSIDAKKIDIYTLNGANEVASLTSGGNMSINAENDFRLAGGKVNAEGNLNLKAGNIDITGIQTTEKTVYKEDGKVVSESTTNWIGSEITSGGNLKISSDKDINIQGSKIAAKGDGTLIAAGDVNVTTGLEYHDAMKTSSKDGFMSSETTTINEGYIKNIASELNFGGGLNIIAEGDVKSVNAKYNVDGNKNVSAGKKVIGETIDGKLILENSGKEGSVKYFEAHDVDWYDKKTVKDGWGLNFDGKFIGIQRQKTTDITEKMNITAKVNEISVSDLNIDASKDIVSKGTVINANNIDLNAANDIKLVEANSYNIEKNSQIVSTEKWLGIYGGGFSEFIDDFNDFTNSDKIKDNNDKFRDTIEQRYKEGKLSYEEYMMIKESSEYNKVYDIKNFSLAGTLAADIYGGKISELFGFKGTSIIHVNSMNTDRDVKLNMKEKTMGNLFNVTGDIKMTSGNSIDLMGQYKANKIELNTDALNILDEKESNSSINYYVNNGKLRSVEVDKSIKYDDSNLSANQIIKNVNKENIIKNESENINEVYNRNFQN